MHRFHAQPVHGPEQSKPSGDKRDSEERGEDGNSVRYAHRQRPSRLRLRRRQRPRYTAVSNPYATPPIVQRFQLPTESFSTTAQQIEETVNIKDPEDAIKYFPSLFVRKRNDGDNQAVLATRTWGLNSSARTLIYMDDLLVSALIGNNNSGASPHWNLITPEAIERIDFLNGPYAAAYPGNSIGGVLLITTKMPDKPEVTAKQTISIQPWHQYNTTSTYPSSETSATAGNRTGPSPGSSVPIISMLMSSR